MLSRVDGVTSAREIVQMIPLPAEQTQRSLLGLLSTGVVEYVGVRRRATPDGARAPGARAAAAAPAHRGARPPPPTAAPPAARAPPPAAAPRAPAEPPAAGPAPRGRRREDGGAPPRDPRGVGRAQDPHPLRGPRPLALRRRGRGEGGLLPPREALPPRRAPRRLARGPARRARGGLHPPGRGVRRAARPAEAGRLRGAPGTAAAEAGRRRPPAAAPARPSPPRRSRPATRRRKPASPRRPSAARRSSSSRRSTGTPSSCWSRRSRPCRASRACAPACSSRAATPRTRSGPRSAEAMLLAATREEPEGRGAVGAPRRRSTRRRACAPARSTMYRKALELKPDHEEAAQYLAPNAPPPSRRRTRAASERRAPGPALQEGLMRAELAVLALLLCRAPAARRRRRARERRPGHRPRGRQDHAPGPLQTPYGALVIPADKVERIRRDDGSEEVLNVPAGARPDARRRPRPPRPSWWWWAATRFWQAWDPKAAPEDPSLRLEVRLDDRVVASYTDVNLDPEDLPKAVVNSFVFSPERLFVSAAAGVTVAPPELAAGQIRLPIALPAELAGRRRLRPRLPGERRRLRRPAVARRRPGPGRGRRSRRGPRRASASCRTAGRWSTRSAACATSRPSARRWSAASRPLLDTPRRGS